MGPARLISRPSTPWARGRLDALHGAPKLLFGQMYEDADIEATVFPSSGRIFAIASAGTTSMVLSARSLQVTAVDINPAQVAYVRDRLNGAPARQGTADRLFAFCRLMYPLLGMTTMRQFLELDDPSEQIQFWHRHLDTWRMRLALRLLINRVALQLIYHRTFLTVMPPRFDVVIRQRFERCFARHPNRNNPYAWQLLAGTEPPGSEPIVAVRDRIELIEADAAEYLESCPPASFDGFTLSNILDGTDDAYRERLMAAVRRAARDEAPVVLRSFGEPGPDESREWLERDRSLLWGVVSVERIRR